MRIPVLCFFVAVAMAGCRLGFDDFSDDNSDALDEQPNDAGPGSNADGDPGSDTDGAPPITAAPCGSPGVFQDEFSGARPHPFWEVADDQATVQNAGLLHVTPSPAMSEAFTGVISSRAVNLTDASTMVEIEDVIGTDLDSVAVFQLRFDDGNHLTFAQTNGQLLAMSQVDAGSVEQQSVPYDRVTHRYWRIRETAGTVHFQTSEDGQVWAPPLLSTDTPHFADTVVTWLGMSTPGAFAPTGQVQFASFNKFTDVAAWCSVDTFQDNFDDNSFDIDKWYPASSFFGSCTVLEVNNAAQFRQPNGTGDVCFYASATGYDLSGSGSRFESRGSTTT